MQTLVAEIQNLYLQSLCYVPTGIIKFLSFFFFFVEERPLKKTFFIFIIIFFLVAKRVFVAKSRLSSCGAGA